MYPLADEYVPAIDAFIAELQSNAGLQVQTNTMSTQIFGEIETIFAALRAGLENAWSVERKSVFVLKLLNSDLRPGS